MQVNDYNVREGLVSLYHCAMGWRSAIRSYRVLLYGKGAQSKGNPDKDKGMIDPERAQQVIRDGGKLSWAEYLRMRVGYFTRGGALGSSEFIESLSTHSDVKSRGTPRMGFLLKGVSASIRSLRRLS